MNKADIVALALNFVYTDIEKLIKAQAKEHTIANLGQSLTDGGLQCSATFYEEHPEALINERFSQLMGDCESDEMTDCVEDEYRSWLKDARESALAVQKKNLPLTLQNTRDHFEKKGAFAKK